MHSVVAWLLLVSINTNCITETNRRTYHKRIKLSYANMQTACVILGLKHLSISMSLDAPSPKNPC